MLLNNTWIIQRFKKKSCYNNQIYFFQIFVVTRLRQAKGYDEKFLYKQRTTSFQFRSSPCIQNTPTTPFWASLCKEFQQHGNSRDWDSVMISDLLPSFNKNSLHLTRNYISHENSSEIRDCTYVKDCWIIWISHLLDMHSGNIHKSPNNISHSCQLIHIFRTNKN